MRRTGDAAPSPEPPPPPRTTVPPVGESARNGADGDNLIAPLSFGDKLQGAAASAAASATEAASTVASAATGGTASGRWGRETFILPLPEKDESLAVQEEEDVGVGRGDVAVDECVEAPDLAESTLKDGQDSDEGSESSGCDDGVNLRVEVWQGKHCYGQVRIVACAMAYLSKTGVGGGG